MNSHIAPIFRSWLVQIHLDLSFPQPIAAAIDFSPAQRPDVPVRRQHLEYWRNMRVSHV